MPTFARPWQPWALAWLALGLVAAAPLLGSGDVLVDEAIQAATAWRMAQGSVLYTELHAFAGPLPQLLLVPLYVAFGPSVWAPRLELLLALAASLALLGQGVRRLGGSPAAAWWAGAFLVLAALPAYRGWYHHWLALPFALGALRLAGPALAEAGGWRPFWGVGLLAGLAAACTQTTGLAIALAVGAGVGVLAWAGAWAWPRAGRAWAALAVGALGPWLLLWAGFAAKGAGSALLLRCWWWPFVGYRVPGNANDLAPGRDLPALLNPWAEALSQPFWVAKALQHLALVLLPWGAALGALALLLAWGVSRVQAAAWPLRAREGLLWGLFVVALVGAMAQGRADLAHHAFVAPVAFAWAIALASRGARGVQGLEAGPELRLAARAPAAALVLVVLAAAVHEAHSWRRLAREGRWGWCEAVVAQDPLLQALRARLPQGAPVVAFPEGGLVYLLSGGRPATPFLLLTPQSYRYQSPEDYRRFAEAWAAQPPQAVALTRFGAQQAVAEWGGAPDLKGHRLVFEGRTRLSGQWVPAQLWWREAVTAKP